ncbi:MAG TPA: NAD(P)/FAD-dependent oxidoreductase [Vicinamibacterales bacterium]|nr:NAD(P)/FAD-dependent oxidoreductase [Vicinamibacterales bacterium]
MRVLVAGAGLAGLSAARALEAHGADVVVIEARDRVGGRVWTWREPFRRRHHAEAGADLIEGEQEHTLALAKALRLTPARIHRRGFGYYGPNVRGQMVIQKLESAFHSMAAPLAGAMRDYALSEQRWDSAIALRLGRTPLAAYLDQARTPRWVRERMRGLRGLFLADPDVLSTLAVVDFFATAGAPGGDAMYRIRGGNDRLATGIAARLRRPPRLETILRALHMRDGGLTAVVDHRGRRDQIRADYIVVAIPAATLRDVEIAPAPPDLQQRSWHELRYGAATRLAVQFSSRFWRKPGRPLAFGTNQPFGAVWDANEQQRGRGGILSFLAGGQASAELQAILARADVAGVAKRLRWLGRPADVIASRVIRWEDEPWSRGGYAYLDHRFDPRLRDWLARPWQRAVFAGEHTSIRWQGYVNGAIETGLRAAAEISALKAG